MDKLEELKRNAADHEVEAEKAALMASAAQDALVAALETRVRVLEEALRTVADHGCYGDEEHDREGVAECGWCGPIRAALRNREEKNA